MIFVGISFLVAIGLIVALSHLAADIKTDKNEQEIILIGKTIQQELILASTVTPGYVRSITLPQTVKGNNYQISLNSSNYIVLSYDNIQRFFQIPTANGTISKGENTIRTTNQGIEIT
jgi:hypothetical protein